MAGRYTRFIKEFSATAYKASKAEQGSPVIGDQEAANVLDRLSELEAQVAALTEERGVAVRIGQDLGAEVRDLRKQLEAAESQLAQARDGALEEAARVCIAEADRLALEATRAKRERREVTANLLFGKRESVLTCCDAIRAMKSPQTALSKEKPE